MEVVDEILMSKGMQSREQVVLLKDHRRSTDQVLGSVRNIIRGDGKVTGRLFFVEGDEDVDRIWNKVRQKHVTDVSVGYRVDKATAVDIKPNTEATVNGKKYKSGNRTLRITQAWTLREVSVVPIGADEHAVIREDPEIKKEIPQMDPKLRALLVARGMRADADDQMAQDYHALLTDEERADLQARLKAQETPPAPVASEGSATAPTVQQPPSESARSAGDSGGTVDQDEVIRLERERVVQIRALARGDIPRELVEQAETEGWDLARAATKFHAHATTQRESVPVPSPSSAHAVPSIITRNNGGSAQFDAVIAGLKIRCGLPAVDAWEEDPELHQRQEAGETSARRQGFRNISMAGAIFEGLRARGRTASMHDPSDNFYRAVSTGDVDSIFTPVVNASLQQAYRQYPDTTVGWTRTTTLPDFKTNERPRMQQGQEPTKLPAGGEADHMAISATLESYKAFRYARQWAVDDQDVINDSLNGLREAPVRMGEGAARIRPLLVYFILANGEDGGLAAGDLFRTDHADGESNLLAANSMGEAGIEAAITAMANQTEEDVPLDLQLRFLIMPNELMWVANRALNSAERRSASGENEGTANVLQGENITVVADARLGRDIIDPDSGATATGSTTSWYAATSPTAAPTIEVGYVGSSTPQLRSTVMNMGRWGVNYDLKMDIGAKALDFRGLQKSNA